MAGKRQLYKIIKEDSQQERALAGCSALSFLYSSSTCSTSTRKSVAQSHAYKIGDSMITSQSAVNT